MDSCEIDNDTGSYSITARKGRYLLELKRPGFLTRYVPVTVADSDVTVPDNELFGGDFNQDQVINQADLDLLTNYIANGATSSRMRDMTRGLT